MGGLPGGIPALLAAGLIGAIAAVPPGSPSEDRRRRLRQADQRRAEQFQTRLAETLDPPTLLELAVRYPAELLGATTAALLVRDPAEQRAGAARGHWPAPRLARHRPARRDPPPLPRGERRRAAQALAAPLPRPRRRARARAVRPGDRRAADARVGRIGALLLGPRSEAAPYTPTDLLLLAHLAAQVTGAVERAEIGTRYNRRIQELNTLNHLGQALSTTLDMAAICRTTYDHLHVALEFDSFFIGYWGENHRRDDLPAGDGRGPALHHRPVAGQGRPGRLDLRPPPALAGPRPGGRARPVQPRLLRQRAPQPGLAGRADGRRRPHCRRPQRAELPAQPLHRRARPVPRASSAT